MLSRPRRTTAFTSTPTTPTTPAAAATTAAVIVTVLGAVVLIALAATVTIRVIADGPDTASPPPPPPAGGWSRTPQPTSARAPTSGFDIYPLLPISRNELAAAAALARRWVTAYDSWRHDQPPEEYLAALTPMAAPHLQASLTRAATVPGLIEQRHADQETATSRAALTRLRSIDHTMVIFIVSSTQTLTGRAARAITRQYAVTLTRPPGRGWIVYDLAPAEQGQPGDVRP